MQNLKPEALRGQDRVPGEKKSNLRVQRRPSAAPGRGRHARPFRSEPPSPGGRATSRATGRASTRARGFAAYPRRCPLADSDTGSSSASAPSPEVRPARAAGSRRRAPSLGPAGSVRTPRRRRPWPPLPHRPGPTAAATRAAAPTPGPTADPPRPGRGGGGAGLLPTPPARVRRRPVTPRAGPRRRPSGRAALGALAEGCRGGPRSRYLLRGRVLGVVEIPHLRRRLRRQLLHRERLEAATRAPSPRQGDAREGRGGEEAAGPTAAAAAGAARVASSLVPSLPPSLRRPPAALSPTHSHGERRAPRQPLRLTGPAP